MSETFKIIWADKTSRYRVAITVDGDRVIEVGEVERLPLLGDRVAETIHRATGGRVKPCVGCGKRQAALNLLDNRFRGRIRGQRS